MAIMAFFLFVWPAKRDDGPERQTGNKKQKVPPNDRIAIFLVMSATKLEDRPYLATFTGEILNSDVSRFCNCFVWHQR